MCVCVCYVSVYAIILIFFSILHSLQSLPPFSLTISFHLMLSLSISFSLCVCCSHFVMSLFPPPSLTLSLSCSRSKSQMTWSWFENSGMLMTWNCTIMSFQTLLVVLYIHYKWTCLIEFRYYYKRKTEREREDEWDEKIARSLVSNPLINIIELYSINAFNWTMDMKFIYIHNTYIHILMMVETHTACTVARNSMTEIYCTI